MAKIETYSVEHRPTGGKIRVEIDFDFISKVNTPHGEIDYPVMTEIRDIVHFWTGAELRLEANKGSYLFTFLKMLTEYILRILADNNFNLEGVIEEMKSEEGWPALDGTYGIKLTFIEGPNLSEQYDYQITQH